MAPETQCRLPVVSVIHYDVGHDRSITIEEFLGGLKRDFSSSSTTPRQCKHQGRNPPVESGRHIEPTSKFTPFLEGLDNTDSDDFVDQNLEARHSTQRNRTSVTPTQVTANTSRHGMLRRSSANYEAEDLPAEPGFMTSRVKHTQGQGTQGQVPKSYITYSNQKHNSKRNKKQRQSLSIQAPVGEQRKRRRRCAPANELMLVDTIEECAGLDKNTKNERTPLQKPLSVIRHNIRLSKAKTIDPTEFKIPPSTPSTTRPPAWELGSGFKKPRQRRVSKSGRSPTMQADMVKSAPHVQVTSNRSLLPGIEVQGTSVVKDARHSRLPGSTISWDSMGGRTS
ncbi:MAG: hypothetical protein Q9166_002724 [cf. Caloplaca sp. 2 TL-2023]